MNQGVKVRDIIAFIESEAPLELAEDWDNAGLMVGSPDDVVGGVLLCLDITDEIIEEAMEYGCRMIITHHPFIFRPLKNIRGDSSKGSLIMKVIRNQMVVYSAHTNLDYARSGVNQCLAEKLGLKNTDILRPHPRDFSDKTDMVFGLGRVGDLDHAMEIEEFCRFVKEKLNAHTVRLAGRSTRKNVRRVAVYGGAFDADDMEYVIESKADVLVTGDLKYNPVMEQRDTGIYLLDAGHFSTERVVLDVLKDKIGKEFSDVLFFVSKEERDPFVYI